MKSAQEMRKIANKVVEESNCEDILGYVENEIEVASLKGENRTCINFATPRRDERGAVICSHSLDMAIEKTKKILIENGYKVNGSKLLFIYDIFW